VRKSKLKWASLVAAFGILASGSALAADGTIMFNGEITGATCTINEGQPDFDVTLPKVSNTILANSGETAGRTPFRITLTDCTPATGTVGVYFEPGANTDMTNGRLNTTAGGAANVQIQLLNADISVINLSQATGTQTTQTAPIVDGSGELLYFAEYYATGATTTGLVNSSTMYSIVYP